MVLTVDPYNKVGAAISSKVLYDEGSFEFVAKTNVPNGACVAFWTFYYNDEDGDETTPNINNEIDFELYGTNNIIYSTYLKDIGEQKHINSTVDYNIADNEYHTYKLNWYKGEKVEFYIDGELVATITEYVPTEKMKVWIGVWCPEWSIQKDDEGNADPAIVPGTYTMTVKSFSYTTFAEDYQEIVYVNPVLSRDLSADNVVNNPEDIPTLVGFTDENGNTVEIDSSLYTVHYYCESTGYNSPEKPTEYNWYSIVITFKQDTNYKFVGNNDSTFKVFNYQEAN